MSEYSIENLNEAVSKIMNGTPVKGMGLSKKVMAYVINNNLNDRQIFCMISEMIMKLSSRDHKEYTSYKIAYSRIEDIFVEMKCSMWGIPDNSLDFTYRKIEGCYTNREGFISYLIQVAIETLTGRSITSFPDYISYNNEVLESARIFILKNKFIQFVKQMRYAGLSKLEIEYILNSNSDYSDFRKYGIWKGHFGNTKKSITVE